MSGDIMLCIGVCVARLEDTNSKLSRELQEREDDLMCLQDDMHQLTEQMGHMSDDYSREIEQYKRELWASSKLGRYTAHTQTVTASLKELKQKLNQLQEFGERIMLEKRQAEVTSSLRSL